MRRHVAMLASLLGAFSYPARAQEIERPVPEIRTEGTVQRNVRPDHARITMEFSAVGATPKEAGKRLAARADSLRRALQALGIPRDSLSTGSRWSHWRGRIEVLPGSMRYVSPPPGTAGPTLSQQDTAYRAHDAIEVRTKHIAKVGPAIDAALELGITQISGIHFSATVTDSVREQALREAAAKARRQALAIAEASGAKLGRILSLSTTAGYPNGGPEMVTMSVRAGPGGGPTTDVVEPVIPVSVTVHGRWELLSAP